MESNDIKSSPRQVGRWSKAVSKEILMDENSFSFTVYMIHACANRWNVAPSRVYQALKKSGCLDRYLIPSYDILHTQSTDYVVQDIEEYLQEREVAV